MRLPALVAKSLPKPLAHISSLKHLVDLRLERNPNYRPADPNDAAATPESKFYCPVTGQDFNGRFRFVALRPSGHVVSERAIKQVGSSALLLKFACSSCRLLMTMIGCKVESLMDFCDAAENAFGTVCSVTELQAQT